MLLLAIAFIAVGCFFGFELFSALTIRHIDVVTRAGVGSLFGIIISAWGMFISNLWIKLDIIHGCYHSLILLILALVVQWLRKKEASPKPLNWVSLVFSVVIPFTLLVYMFQTGLLDKENITKGACYGDLPFHLNIISSFAWGCNSERKHLFDVVSPFYAHEKLAYPFIPNFYSAVLLSCFDLTYHQCVLLPSLVAAFALLAVLSRIVKKFTDSDFACGVAPWLFLLSGGLGFTRWFDPEIRKEYYVDYVHGWGKNRNEYWFQTVIHILMPQRASLFSMPFAYAIIFMLMTVGSIPALDIHAYTAIGLLVAVLPQVQPHSIIATAQWGIVNFLICFPWKNIRKSLPVITNYFVLAGVAVVVGVPQILPFMNRLHGSFIQMKWIWYGESDRNFFTLWGYGLGVFFVLSMSVCFFLMSKAQFKWYIPSLVVFFIANYVWYQPWHLDNTKVFNAAWIPLAVACVSHVLVKIWKSVRFLGPALALALFAGCVASGSLAVWGAATHKYPVWGARDMPFEIAEFVKKATPPKSVWITDSWHGHPIITLAGRQTLAGYGGWLASHGLSEYNRKRAMDKLNRNPEDTSAIDKFGVDYACVRLARHGVDFRFDPGANSKSWRMIYESRSYRIYQRVK